jgi:glycine/D-amino acid oxidase-like deaminating enzyme
VGGITIIGDGVLGLGCAFLLSERGHDVTVLERDGEAPQATPEENWWLWKRQGVNQSEYLRPRASVSAPTL